MRFLLLYVKAFCSLGVVQVAEDQKLLLRSIEFSVENNKVCTVKRKMNRLRSKGLLSSVPSSRENATLCGTFLKFPTFVVAVAACIFAFNVCRRAGGVLAAR